MGGDGGGGVFFWVGVRIKGGESRFRVLVEGSECTWSDKAKKGQRKRENHPQFCYFFRFVFLTRIFFGGPEIICLRRMRGSAKKWTRENNILSYPRHLYAAPPPKVAWLGRGASCAFGVSKPVKSGSKCIGNRMV